MESRGTQMSRTVGPDRPRPGTVVSRRQLLEGAVAAVPPILLFPMLTAHASQSAARKQASGSHVITRDQFVQLIGSEFHVTAGGRTVGCRLESVTDLPAPSPPSGEAFALSFARTQRLGFGQGTYPITHHGLGTFSLLLVPTGPASVAHRCEAVINRSSA